MKSKDIPPSLTVRPSLGERLRWERFYNALDRSVKEGTRDNPIWNRMFCVRNHWFDFSGEDLFFFHSSWGWTPDLVAIMIKDPEMADYCYDLEGYNKCMLEHKKKSKNDMFDYQPFVV